MKDGSWQILLSNRIYENTTASLQRKACIGSWQCNVWARILGVVGRETRYAWREELQIKARSKTHRERQRAQRHHKPKYHHAMCMPIERHSDGWTCVGKEYAEMIKQYTTLKACNTWSVLQRHWKSYHTNNYNRWKSYYQELRENNKQEADGEKIDEEDWMVDTDETSGVLDDFLDDFWYERRW